MGISLLTIISRSSYLLAAALLLSILNVSLAAADSYGVSAQIDFPAPSQAAVIDPTLDNTIVSQAFFTVSGTCEVASPYFVISIERNGTVLGSTNCQPDGTFLLNVSLISGSNVLIARSASVSHLYGPDSQPITVTLNLPATPVVIPPPNSPPAAASSNPPAKPSATISPVNLTGEQEAAINKGAQDNLYINSTQAFSVLDNDHAASIEIIVGGGRSPYTITINWGDGSASSKVVDQPSKYTFSHTYAKPATYHVTGEVRDVLGAVTRFEYLITTGTADPIAHTTAASSFHPKKSTEYLSVLMLSAFSLVGITSFVLGRTSLHPTPIKSRARKTKVA